MAEWVFAYGSLLWNPEFTPVEWRKAKLTDYHRSFCMLSIHHRGTPTDPGLVLALDAKPNAACDGLALRIAPDDHDSVLAMLRERELVSSAYVEYLLPVQLDTGEIVEAYTYVIDPDHEQYCDYPLEKQANLIAGAVGGRGPNHEYLENTYGRLQELGVDDAELLWLVNRVRELRAS